MKTRIVPVILFSLVAGIAFGAGGDRQDRDDRGQNEQAHHQWHDRGFDWGDRGRDRHVLAAPELDPGQAVGALVLLSGTLAILRGYRRKK